MSSITAIETANSPNDHHHHEHGSPRMGFYRDAVTEKGMPFSRLLPYTGMILTVCCIVLFLVRWRVVEPAARYFYNTRYTRLDDVQRRTFINHHIAGGIKFCLLIFGFYPFVALFGGYAGLQSSWGPTKSVTMADVWVVLVQILCAMYIFELLYRSKCSWISSAHHIGAIVIGQTACVISIGRAHEKDATFEFILVLLWGAFDIVAEMWPHIAMIIYRLYPENHRLLKRVLLSTAALELLGTLVETVTVMSIFGTLWHDFTISFKILTPILHILFSIAQLWGVRVFLQMWRRQQRLLDEKTHEGKDQEKGKKLNEADANEQEVNGTRIQALTLA